MMSNRRCFHCLDQRFSLDVSVCSNSDVNDIRLLEDSHTSCCLIRSCSAKQEAEAPVIARLLSLPRLLSELKQMIYNPNLIGL